MVKASIQDLLVKHGIVTEAQLMTALRDRARFGGRLLPAVVSLGVLTEAELAAGIARAAGLRRIGRAAMSPAPDALALVDRAWAAEHAVLPLSMSKATATLAVAAADPTDPGIKDLGFRLLLQVDIAVASESEVQEAIQTAYGGAAGGAEAAEERALELDLGGEGDGGAGNFQITNLAGVEQQTVDVKALRANVDEGAKATLAQRSAQSVMAELRRVYRDNADSSAALRALFELCVEKGLVTREEYFARLKAMPDD